MVAAPGEAAFAMQRLSSEVLESFLEQLGGGKPLIFWRWKVK